MSNSEWVLSAILQTPIEASKTALAVPRTAGAFKSQIANAFGQTSAESPKRSNSAYLKKRVARFREQEEAKRGTFMTETEVNERKRAPIQESKSVDVVREKTFEELMKEVDEMQANMDSLEEVRRNIRRCQRGLEAHSQSTNQLNRVLENLEVELRPYAEAPEERRRTTLPPVNQNSSRMLEAKKTTDLAVLD